MCAHIHTYHNFCHHMACTVYPCVGSNCSCDVRLCLSETISPGSLSAFEQSACHKCLLQAGIKLDKSGHTSFSVADYRAVRFWAEIRRDFSRLCMLQDEDLAQRWGVGMSVPASSNGGPQDQPYDRSSQPLLNYMKKDWNMSPLFSSLVVFQQPAQMTTMGIFPAPQMQQQFAPAAPVDGISSLAVPSQPFEEAEQATLETSNFQQDPLLGSPRGNIPTPAAPIQPPEEDEKTTEGTTTLSPNTLLDPPQEGLPQPDPRAASVPTEIEPHLPTPPITEAMAEILGPAVDGTSPFDPLFGDLKDSDPASQTELDWDKVFGDFLATAANVQ